MERYEITIAIDAGHGLNTAGKRCTVPPYDTREWVLNNRIATKLKTMLDRLGYHTIMVYDTTGVNDTPLSTRCKTANNYKANLYISIHHNAANTSTACGTTVYYYPYKTATKRLIRETEAKMLYDNVVMLTGLSGNRASKTVGNAFYVLSHTNCPAFLLENGFMTSPVDCPIINTTENAERTAIGLCNFVEEFFDTED